MFPEQLRFDVSSNAEKLLHQTFQEQLSDNFTVFHQVRWQARNLRSGARDGEADFVIACPNLGILVLEVKGGSIRYDGTKDQWYSNGKSIKNPFLQACESKHNLLSRLRELQYWRHRWIPMGYAVALPDIEINGKLPLDAPREIILDATQLSNLSSWVQAVLNYWRGQEAPRGSFDVNGVKELVKILSPSITPQLLLVKKSEDEQEFKRLTEQQIGILDFLASHRRVAISGCAGSGKTLLALEKASRLNEQGFSVLLTCYNKGLATFLEHFLRQSFGWKPNLHVYTFHGLCEKLFRQAGFAAPDQNIPEEKRFKEIYPNLLIAAADRLRWRVDAVIVDEGQDFCEDWWIALKLLLNDPDNGIFYLFYDDNQKIYGSNWKPPLEEAPFALTKNCRNTQKIHSYVLQFHNQPNSTIALGPIGRDVEIHNYRGDIQLRNTLGKLLHRLVVNEGLKTKDIVILTTTRKQALQNQIVGQFRVKADPNPNSNEILCNTIHSYKGLESPVAILVETELNINNEQKNNLLYVGASRARHHLIILRPSSPGLAS
jgi:hypothetical protein